MVEGASVILTLGDASGGPSRIDANWSAPKDAKAHRLLLLAGISRTDELLESPVLSTLH